MMKKRKLKRYRRKGPNNRVGMILVSAVLLMVFAASMVKIISLKQTQKVYDEKKEYYSTLVEDELVEFEKYTQTDAYIEEVAKQRFGLVKDGEIIFVAEEK